MTLSSSPTALVPTNVTRSRLLEAIDRCHDLRDIADAYAALENFISPEVEVPDAAVQANRRELRALLCLLNAEAGRRIEVAIEAVEVAREGS